MPLLRVRDLQVHFRSASGIARAVQGLSFEINAGETLAIVGESGCGKSTTSMALMGLVPRPAGRTAGVIEFEGKNLLSISETEMNSVRGKSMAMIFQEPMTSLNPVMRVADQIIEALQLHTKGSADDYKRRALELLALVGIADPARRLREYPHQMSGGMRQRVMIAIALACNPKLLIADEPTTALDVTIQAQILSLITELKEKTGLAVLLITHDLGVVAETADRVMVMYAGRKIEEAPVAEIFSNPKHPYTKGLLRAVPRLGATGDEQRNRLHEIPGSVPSLSSRFHGCSFSSRCSEMTDLCERIDPCLEAKAPVHFVACHHVNSTGGPG